MIRPLSGAVSNSGCKPRLLVLLQALMTGAATVAIASCGGADAETARDESVDVAHGSTSAIVDTEVARKPSRKVASGEAPNLVVIETDDQALNSFRRSIMPRTFRLLVDQGTRFTQSLAAPPLCCPSRAGFLTGQYPHNHGVFTNDDGYAALRDPESTLPSWLQAAGYRTGLTGKYLNGTDAAIGTGPGPGWDRWFALASNPGMRDPLVSDGGHRERAKGYITTAITREARRFIEGASGARDPFFLWVPHWAPHAARPINSACTGGGLAQPSLSAYRAYDGPGFSRVKAPSFNEGDISDKPSVARHPRFDRAQKDELRRRWHCAAAAVAQVDESVAAIMRELRDAGELQKTVVVFTSDNGFFFGEHRLAHGKARPFEEAFKVPLVMRIPPGVLDAPPPRRIDKQVAQIDLPATFLQLAGAEPCLGSEACRRMDGRSLVPLLRGDASTWPAERATLLEVGEACKRRVGIRIVGWSYSDRLSPCHGKPELYNHARDPYELKSVAERHPSRAQDLRDRLFDLRECSGVEGRDPRHSNAPFCE